jgi:heavy metal translocating P-type ATPase
MRKSGNRIFACILRSLVDESRVVAAEGPGLNATSFTRLIPVSSRLLLVLIAVLGLTCGGLAVLAGHQPWADRLWFAGTLPVLLALLVEIVTSLRRGKVGLDIVAGLSMSAALAFGEPLAGNVVALMYAGGQQLESFAEGKARREMTALLGRVSRTAMRYAGSRLDEVDIERLQPGDRILIRHGEVIPVDGKVAAAEALLDEAALTGEALPVRRPSLDDVQSGSTCVGDAFDLMVERRAAESTYANIVRLVEGAQESKAPMVRLADRYAIWFLLLTVAIAGAAWGLTGDRLRALAVLVVATPCPLILAVPVAIISGMSRAAALGVLIKSGGGLEGLAAVRTAILDKTGTLTFGRASVTEIRIVSQWDPEELLRLAASLDQASTHVTAEALVKAALERGLRLSGPTDVQETAGTGIAGLVDGRRVVVGGSGFVHARSTVGDPRDLRDGVPAGTVVVAVAVDGAVAGIIILADPVRPDAPDVIASFREAGISRIVLASGDRDDVVAAVGRQLKLDGAQGELDPPAKVEIVIRERAAAPVMMVGDGVNDAPALAAANVGVAMGARGSAASSEAADIVVLVDRLDRLAGALQVAHRSRRIALQSVAVGIGLSVAAMGVAAFGYLPPVQGALLQELIDVAVILNALRALRPG